MSQPKLAFILSQNRLLGLRTVPDFSLCSELSIIVPRGLQIQVSMCAVFPLGQKKKRVTAFLVGGFHGSMCEMPYETLPFPTPVAVCLFLLCLKLAGQVGWATAFSTLLWLGRTTIAVTCASLLFLCSSPLVQQCSTKTARSCAILAYSPDYCMNAKDVQNNVLWHMVNLSTCT